MNEIAICGLDCSNCPVHIATLETDPDKKRNLRISIAGQILEIYGNSVDPDDVNDCDGCRSIRGRLFSGCAECKIRSCAIEKHLIHCGLCNEYPCVLLLQHFKTDPEARIRLDAIRGRV